MTRRQKDPLRSLSVEERQIIEQLSRARREPAVHVVRAQLLLAVEAGASYTDAADSVGRRSGDAVSHLVSRFNQEGLAALEPHQGGGPKRVYDSEQRTIIMETLSHAPDPEGQGVGP